MKNYGLGNFNAFLLALIIYICIIAFIFFRLVSKLGPAIEYTDIKDSFVNIQLSEPLKKVIVQQNTPKKLQKQAEQIDIKKLFNQSVNKTVQNENIKQKINNFNELFGNIKELPEEKATKIQLNSQSSLSPSVPKKTQASDLLKEFDENLLEEKSLIQDENTQVQKKGIYDEFLGKVVRIITQRWTQYYPNSEKISVRVKIFIDENGNFGYTWVEKSGNLLYDAKVAQFLENQKGKFITYTPKNEHINIIMNLKDEVKTKND